MLTFKEALECNEFFHVSLRNRDGSALRARRNGKTQTWKTRPGLFRIPVCHGLKGYFQIQSGGYGHSCPNSWLPFDPTTADGHKALLRRNRQWRKAQLAKIAGLLPSAPMGVIKDKLRDMGRDPKTGKPVATAV